MTTDTIDVTRPWHWGVAIVSDPASAGELPPLAPGAAVAADGSALVLAVRHAQDVEASADEPFFAVTLSIRRRSAPPVGDVDGTTVFEGRLDTPSGRLVVGDADEDTVLEGFTTRTAVRVVLAPDDVESPDQVWLDVWPG